MTDIPFKQAIHKIIERRSTGKTSFGEFLEELAEIGVMQYDVDVATGQTAYQGKNIEIKTEPQVHFVISNDFNRNQAVEIISNVTLPFLDFLRELANAGIKSYNVNITGKKAIYTGMSGEQIVEPLQL